MDDGQAYTYWKVRDCLRPYDGEDVRGLRSGEEYETKRRRCPWVCVSTKVHGYEMYLRKHGEQLVNE
jgi:hypothetical protein